jgi:hypothetical protein
MFLKRLLSRDEVEISTIKQLLEPPFLKKGQDFKVTGDPATLAACDEIDMAALYWPWAQQRALKFSPATTAVTPWKI